jgi:hypothetical protein
MVPTNDRRNSSAHIDEERSIGMTVQRGLAYLKLSVAGAIGGIALYNTVLMLIGSAPTNSAEGIAMGAGAIVTAAIVKILHVV